MFFFLYRKGTINPVTLTYNRLSLQFHVGRYPSSLLRLPCLRDRPGKLNSRLRNVMGNLKIWYAIHFWRSAC
jgi:hypothetical protein